MAPGPISPRSEMFTAGKYDKAVTTEFQIAIEHDHMLRFLSPPTHQSAVTSFTLIDTLQCMFYRTSRQAVLSILPYILAYKYEM